MKGFERGELVEDGILTKVARMAAKMAVQVLPTELVLSR